LHTDHFCMSKRPISGAEMAAWMGAIVPVGAYRKLVGNSIGSTVME
jgi:hypothetical protein